MPLSLHVITGKKPPKSEEERKKVRMEPMIRRSCAAT